MTTPPERIHSPMIMYFDAIRRAGSVREAARRLNIASSAVDRQPLNRKPGLARRCSSDRVGAIMRSDHPLANEMSPSMAKCLSHVQHGLGLSFQTRIGIENELRSGDLVHIPIAEPRVLRSDLGVYARAARNPPVAVAALADIFAGSIGGDADAIAGPWDGGDGHASSSI